MVVSRQTSADLSAIAAFFGIDLEVNKHIFRHAAQVDGRSFEVSIRALAEACRQDIRFGTSSRIRKKILDERRAK